VFAQVALDDCRRWPGLKVLYLRKALKQAREQFDDLRRRVLRGVEHEFNRSAGVVTLWDDSRIFLGHFHNEADVDAYLGLEYDVIAIEEATTLSAAKYKALRDSNRSSSGWRPRLYATTNPGGVGHAWFKARFIDPWRKGEEAFTRFIPATVDNNAFLDADYRRRLEENSGWKLRAYRYGDWDIAAGQYFTNWRHEVHVIEPFQIPPAWTVWAALDYGFTHPTVCYLLARDGDGTIYVLDEHRQSKWLGGRLRDGDGLLVVELRGDFAGLLVDSFWSVFLDHEPALDHCPAPAVGGFRQGYSIGDLDAARHVLDDLQQRNFAGVHLPNW
jgi:hypothetical protein